MDTSHQGIGEVLWENMRVPQLEELSHKGAVVIFALGSTEQHGPHLPVGTDAKAVTAICIDAARRVSSSVPVVVLPTFTVGLSAHHLEFCGTLTLQPDTFIQAAYEVCQSAVHHGFKKFVIVSGHAGNDPGVQLLASRIGRNYPVVALAFNYWDLALSSSKGDVVQDLFNEFFACHAGQMETSLQMYLNPELVDPNFRQLPRVEIKREPPPGTFLYCTFKDQLDQGYFGDPSLASREKGKESLSLVAEALAQIVLKVTSWSIRITADDDSKQAKPST